MNLLKKIFKLVFNVITYLIIIILLLYLLLVFYQKAIVKSELLSFGKFYIFQIASSSMESDLHIGDYIVVLKDAAYQEGDIITFLNDGIYITHRVKEIKNNELITKGDANQTADDSINKNEVLGKVLFKANILTFIVKYKYILIILVLILLTLDELLKKDNPKIDNNSQD